MPDPAIPPYKDLLWPTLRAVREIGDSGTIEEIVEKVIELERFGEAQQEVPHGDGPQSEIEYRLAWSRTYLKGMGALVNSKRGVWSTTELGRSMTADDVDRRHTEYVVQLREARKAKKAAEGREDPVLGRAPEDEPVQDWKERLIEELLRIPPDSFERLARRLLREAGFISATVTGKTGDGGIDGIGVYRLSLVSFPVFFQCKRYKGSVGAGAVRDFRGAMSGRWTCPGLRDTWGLGC
jgi:restriction system protein